MLTRDRLVCAQVVSVLALLVGITVPGPAFASPPPGPPPGVYALRT